MECACHGIQQDSLRITLQVDRNDEELPDDLIKATEIKFECSLCRCDLFWTLDKTATIKWEKAVGG